MRPLGQEPTVPQRAADVLRADLSPLGLFVKTLILEREILSYLNRLQTTLHLRTCVTFTKNRLCRHTCCPHLTED